MKYVTTQMTQQFFNLKYKIPAKMNDKITEKDAAHNNNISLRGINVKG